jgi:integrase
MSITWDKRNRRWRFYFDRTIGSQRARSSKLLPKAWSLAQARAYDKAEEGRLYALATGVRSDDDRPPITRAVQLYLDHRLPELRNGKKAAYDLAQIVPWVTNRALPDLPDVARDYRADNPNLAPATIRNRLAYLKAAVRYAYRRHALGDRDYSDRMEMPAVRNERHEYLEVHEFKALRAKIDNQTVKDLLTLAFYTGLRWRSNILTLTREQIIRRDNQTWLIIPRTKNDAPLMLPVHKDALSALRSVPFTIGEKAIYDAFHAARKAAGRPGLHIHDLRHSLASVLVSQGATLPEVGAVLGHKAVQSTKRYAHLYPQRIAEIVGRIGVREKLTGSRKK